MRLLDLFSGIGGFSLGLERAGFKTVAFCEIDPFCRRVLAKHWPGVPCYDDVRALTAARLAADGVTAGAPEGGRSEWLLDRHTAGKPESAFGRLHQGAHAQSGGVRRIDAICGGFPCQDISTAGKGAGIDGERSGLWREYARLVRELRPRWVIIENVPALRTRGADRVLGDLEEAGYAAWPLVVGAVHAGAPHKRQRVWIVANAIGDAGIARRSGNASEGPRGRDVGRGAVGAHVADAARVQPGRPEQRPERQRAGAGGEQGDVADPGCSGHAQPRAGRRDASDSEAHRSGQADEPVHGGIGGAGWWLAEPDVGRVANGVPQRVDRLRALGNAVVPQVVEAIGRAVMRVAA